MKRTEIEKFIQFAKEHFGIDVSLEKSDCPDSFETFFGESFLYDAADEQENLLVQYNEVLFSVSLPQYKKSSFFKVDPFAA